MPERNGEVESQESLTSNNRRDKGKCMADNARLRKALYVLGPLAVVSFLGLIGAIGVLIGQNNTDFQLPPLNFARFELRDGATGQAGATVSGWKMTDRSGNDDIISGDDEYGKFTVEKSALYLLQAQITFNNKAPQNVATISVNGDVWEQQTHSSPLQLNKNGDIVDSITPCTVSGYHYLKTGDTITIGTGYSGRQASVLSKGTVFYIVEMR